MNSIYSPLVHKIVRRISDEEAKVICDKIRRYFFRQKFNFGSIDCYLCDSKAFKNGYLNRGCRLINQVFDDAFSNGDK